MNLKEKLLDELKVAMREKDTVKKNTLQLARAAVLQYEKDNRTTLDNDGIVSVIAKEVKKYKDALPEYEKSGRQDLIDELKRKIDILMPYLPSQLSEEEIQKIVDECIAETGASSMKDMGKVMSVIMPKVNGRCDGHIINSLIKQRLS